MLETLLISFFILALFLNAMFFGILTGLFSGAFATNILSKQVDKLVYDRIKRIDERVDSFKDGL